MEAPEPNRQLAARTSTGLRWDEYEREIREESMQTDLLTGLEPCWTLGFSRLPNGLR